jgi:hypothetical protein
LTTSKSWFWKMADYSVWYCTQHWGKCWKCWNNCTWTHCSRKCVPDWDMGALLLSRIKAVHQWMVSQAITTQKIHDTAASWQYHGKCFGSQKEWFMLIVFHIMYSKCHVTSNKAPHF